MDTKNLYTFKKIVETGSFQAAAQALHYAPSTVSFQIRQLENELSVKLFKKNGLKNELTKEGQELFPLIERILESSEKLLSLNNTIKPPQTLNLGIHESLTTYYLQETFLELKKSMPELTVNIQAATGQSVRELLLNGTIDIGIYFGFEPTQEEALTTKQLFQTHFVLVGPNYLDEKTSDFITPNQTKDLCILYYIPNTFSKALFEEYLNEKNIVVQSSLTLNGCAAVLRGVFNNIGVSFVPYFVVHDFLESGLLKEIKLDLPVPVIRNAYCAYNKQRPITPAMEYFLELLEQSSEISS